MVDKEQDSVWVEVWGLMSHNPHPVDAVGVGRWIHLNVPQARLQILSFSIRLRCKYMCAPADHPK